LPYTDWGLVVAENALLVEQQDHVLVVTMNRPERRNAINLAMVEAFAETWDRAEQDDSVRVVVLTGAGESYCAGGDLSEGWMAKAGKDGTRKQGPDSSVIGRALLLTRGLTKPIVASVNGPCLGGGCEMLQQTDVRVAEEQATFGLPEVQRGLIPGAGSTVRLKRQISYTKAMEMILTGDRLTAAEALQAGLVGRVVPRGTGLEVALGLARRIAANGPLAIRNAKQSVVESGWLAEEDALAIERRLSREVMGSAQAAEGLRAFAEKRPPVFE
jgi:enoyl-CoA hydratase